MTRAVMVDIETASSRNDAAILSIGACAFDEGGTSDLTRGGRFYVVVDLDSCIERGLAVSGSTFYWWLQQSDEARKALLGGPAFPGADLVLSEFGPRIALPAALVAFNAWGSGLNADEVWAWPPQFDLTILRNAYRACGDVAGGLLRPWWHYRQERDCRTLMRLAGIAPKSPEAGEGTKHNALDDAVRQAEVACGALRVVRERTAP